MPYRTPVREERHVTRSQSAESDAVEVAARPDAELETARRFGFEDLAAIQSFDDALQLATRDGQIIESDALGDGFKMCEDKAKLVGVPFVVVDWEYGKNTDYGNKFVIVRLVTKHNEKLIFTDGSTGIKRQLEVIHQLSKGKVRSILCKGGLRASDFWVSDEPGHVGEIIPAEELEGFKGKKKKATTYYIDQV